MSSSDDSYKSFVKKIKNISRVELERLCKESGMSQKEIHAVVSYIYDEKSVAQIADELNISIGQFHYKKKRTINRLRNYIVASEYFMLKIV